MLIAACAAIGFGLLFADALWIAPGSDFHEFIQLIKSSYLAALKMLIAPMIFVSLICGVIGISDTLQLKQLGGITIAYYFGTTLIAIVLGLIAVFFIHPWTNYPATMDFVGDFPAGKMIASDSDSILGVLQNLGSLALTNPLTALTELNILGIVTNALLIGIAMVVVLPSDSPLLMTMRHLNSVIMKILQWVIKLLPIGIFAILLDFTLALSVGDGNSVQLLMQLLQFSLLVIALTMVHGLVVLPLIAALVAKKNPWQLLKQISQPLIVAFSTSSSAATLPVSMRACNEELAIHPAVTSFVLPLGATMNMDGTALFEAVAAVFLAYLFGVELSNVAILTVFLMAMVSSIGAPGMPSASMAGMQVVLLSVGIPLEAIAILLIIERPLDTIRTALNVEGDIIGALVVARHTRTG